MLGLVGPGRCLLGACGLVFGLLTAGLVLGAVLVSLFDPNRPLGLPLGSLQIQSLPAMLLLALAALLIA